MTNLDRSSVGTHAAPRIAQSWVREIAVGFLYWLVFLLALEPGNVLRAIEAGGALAWNDEVARILGASLLGATSTPLLLALMRRFPIEGGRVWRNATIHSLSSAAIAFGLILVSCVLAAWLKIGDTRPVQLALPDQVAANWMLLVFCIAAFTAVAHAVRFFRRAEESRRRIAELQTPSLEPQTPRDFLTSVSVKSRGRLAFVNMADVDWIETQGNYLALHAGAAAHLIRETSVRFEEKIDPSRFVRIHRRTIVAADRIREISSLANGDASVRLIDGTELRVSRGFREKIRAALDSRARA